MKILKTLLALVLLSTPALAGMNYPPIVAGQIPGTTTNNNAASGKIGEYVINTIASSSPVPITTGGTGTVFNSINLTPGDWDVSFQSCYIGDTTTSLTRLVSSVSTTTTIDNTLPRRIDMAYPASLPFVNGAICLQSLPARFSLGTTTTINQLGYADFTISTLSVYGIITARRVR